VAYLGVQPIAREFYAAAWLLVDQHERYEATAAELEWECVRHAVDLVFVLLDLLRADLHPPASIVERTRDQLRMVAARAEPLGLPPAVRDAALRAHAAAVQLDELDQVAR
jgi:hypothetical protein